MACVFPAAVTERSCMASKRALWVLGGVLLISSAKSILQKTGPAQIGTFGLLPVSQKTNDVRGHQVGGELNALELHAQRTGDRVHQKGLCQTRDPDQECMGFAQHGQKQLLHHFILTDNDLGDFLTECLILLL